MQRLLEDAHIDLAHLHIYYGKLTASILRPLGKAGVPIVQTLHEFKIVCPVYSLLSHGQVCQACNGHAFWHAVVKRCNRGSLARSALSATESYVSRGLGSIRNIDHFIAVSDFLRDKVVELGVPASKVTTVHNSVDTEKVEPSTKRGRHFLFLGRLEPFKGILALVRAAAPLMDVPLVIVGEGSARSDVEAFVEQNDLRHVHLAGFKRGAELQELIQDSICLIAPSEALESFGLVLVEAFAHGRPVIASRIGGITEVVSDGADGFLIPPGDIETLRERMTWMAEHRERAIEMGMAGRHKAETQFNPDLYYQRVMDVYRKVM
jgi:glycosyltransferase involved in cell wall biosynthesis